MAHWSRTVAASRRGTARGYGRDRSGRTGAPGGKAQASWPSCRESSVAWTVEKGGPLNSYALAFGILGGGVVLAAILWLAPHFRSRMTVRRFRKALDHVDLVTLSWAQGFRHGAADDLRMTLPEERRRKRRHQHPDDGGASLV